MINVDGATSESKRNSSVGVVTRDVAGNVHVACCKYLQGQYSVEEVEALAMECGLILAKEQKLSHIILESDALTAVSSVTAAETNGCLGHVYQWIRSLLSSFSSWNIKHVKRDYNRAAHELVQYARQKKESHVWKGVCPPMVVHVIQEDAGWRKDGAGPYGVKNFENNDHWMGFTEYYNAHHYNPQVFVTTMRTPHEFTPFEFIQSKMRHPLPESMVHNENYFGGRLISVEITWYGGGNVVSVVGSWNNWQTKEDLQNIGKIASVTMMVPLGIHYFCFIVDGELKCALNLQRVNNSGGDHYNMLYLQEDALQLAAPANANGGPDLSEFESPASPPSSYNNQLFSFDELEIEPPNLPQQLEEALVDMPPVPNHTQLNHLYCSKTNDADQSVMVNSTERFGARYVTRALYKAASKTKSWSKKFFFY